MTRNLGAGRVFVGAGFVGGSGLLKRVPVEVVLLLVLELEGPRPVPLLVVVVAPWCRGAQDGPDLARLHRPHVDRRRLSVPSSSCV